MITEKQKYLLFDINCFYQLMCQKDQIELGNNIEIYPEISFLAMADGRSGKETNWKSELQNIHSRLLSYGLSQSWINQLNDRLNHYKNSGDTIENFREDFMTSIDILTDMLVSIFQTADQNIPSEEISETVVNEIFLKDYWQGEIVNQIYVVRMLTTLVGFDLKFIIDYATVLNQLAKK